MKHLMLALLLTTAAMPLAGCVVVPERPYAPPPRPAPPPPHWVPGHMDPYGGWVRAHWEP